MSQSTKKTYVQLLFSALQHRTYYYLELTSIWIRRNWRTNCLAPRDEPERLSTLGYATHPARMWIGWHTRCLFSKHYTRFLNIIIKRNHKVWNLPKEAPIKNYIIYNRIDHNNFLFIHAKGFRLHWKSIVITVGRELRTRAHCQPSSQHEKVGTTLTLDSPGKTYCALARAWQIERCTLPAV